MTAPSLSHQPRPAVTLGRLATPAGAIAAIVVIAAIARIVAGFERATPRYLPDEFLYPQLARSLGQGDGVSVLGVPSTFPALLEPLLVAPIWRIENVDLAIRLTQSLHAIVMTLACIPVYALARQLRLSTGAALGCGAVAAFAPGLFFSVTLTADALGYLVALIALTLGVRALSRPSSTTQAAFLGAALLATFARLQYAILIPAFVIAIVIVERGRLRRAARRFLLTSAVVGLAAIGAAIGGPRTLGRYESVSTFGASSETAGWAVSTTLLLALAAGVAIVPGAAAWTVACVTRPDDRTRAAFAALVAPLGTLLIVASAVMTVETFSDRFLERYLIVVIPLLAIAFACWIDEGRPARTVAIVVGVVLIVSVARVPLSGYTGGQGIADSPTLLSLSELERLVGVGNASLVAAAVVSLGSLIAILLAVRRRASAWTALSFTGALFVAVAVGAHASDLATQGPILKGAFSDRASWIDDTQQENVLLVQTPGSNRIDAMLTALWNRSIAAAAPLGNRLIDPIDGLGAPVEIAADGALHRAGTTVRQPVAFALGGTAVAFDDAKVLYDKRFALAIPNGPVRLALVAEGIRSDGKVSPVGRITAYPVSAGGCTVFDVTLTVPEGVPATTLELADSAGGTRRLRVTSTTPGRFEVRSTPTRASTMTYRTLLLGDRPPSPFVGTVADARYTSKSIPCRA